MFLSAMQPPWRQNFVVSAITFEGFKLHSSNLTHALLIQISVVPSKIAAGGHFVKKKLQKNLGIDLARNVIKSYFRTSKMAPGGHFVKILKK